MGEPVTEYGYPFEVIRGDYLRAGIGVAFGLLPLLAADPPMVMTVILVGVTIMFGAYAGATYGRQRTRIVVDGDAVSMSAWRSRQVTWDALTEVRLSYYNTRRARGRGKEADPGKGWMQLRLQSPEGVLRVESTCDGFLDIARRAARAAENNGLRLDVASVSNFRSLDIPISEQASP